MGTWRQQISSKSWLTPGAKTSQSDCSQFRWEPGESRSAADTYDTRIKSCPGPYMTGITGAREQQNMQCCSRTSTVTLEDNAQQ